MSPKGNLIGSADEVYTDICYLSTTKICIGYVKVQLAISSFKVAAKAQEKDLL